MLIVPTPGIKVRDPRSRQHIPAAGIEIQEFDPYWVRRLADGDVVEVKPVQPAKPPSPKVKE